MSGLNAMHRGDLSCSFTTAFKARPPHPGDEKKRNLDAALATAQKYNHTDGRSSVGMSFRVETSAIEGDPVLSSIHGVVFVIHSLCLSLRIAGRRPPGVAFTASA